MDDLAQVAGREAETGTFEKRVVLDEIGLGGHVPRGGAFAVPTSVLVPRASVECPGLGLGLRVGREGPGRGMVTCVDVRFAAECGQLGQPWDQAGSLA